MNQWVKLFRIVIIIIGIIVIDFNIQLFIFCKQQKTALDAVKEKQDVESEFNSHKFKFQEDLIYQLTKDLKDAQQQLKDQKDELADQKDSLAQEAEKRQEVENADKNVQSSLVDIKAETDAIKQEMKSWQKDYVGVLAQLDKKMDDTQEETKAIENNLTALNIPELKENINTLKADLEKMTTTPAPEKKIEHEHFESSNN